MHSTRLPKISGVLNNCALHAFAPELLLAIRFFAMQEAEVKEEVRADLAKHEKYRLKYIEFKNTFAKLYLLNQHELTWRKLYDLLTTSVNYNHTAAQVTLGPVLRQFIQQNREQAHVADDGVAKIKEDGRYALLDAEYVGKWIGQPLGLEVCEHSKAENTDTYLKIKCVVEDSISTVDIYHESNHWERVPKSDMANVISDMDKLSEDASDIDAAVTKMTAEGSKAATMAGLTMLQNSVKKQFQRLTDSSMITVTQQDYIAELKPAIRTYASDLFVEFNKADGKLVVAKEDQIAAQDIETACANENESDEAFALRLQQAEIQAALDEVKKRNAEKEEVMIRPSENTSIALETASEGESDEEFARRLQASPDLITQENNASEKQPKKKLEMVYSDWMSSVRKLAETGFFSIPKHEKIKPTVVDLHIAERKTGESDRDFAMRLQQAQLEYDLNDHHRHFQINQLD